MDRDLAKSPIHPRPKCAIVLRSVASRSSSDRRRGPPLGLLGLAVLVALVAAYLSDCIPGLGTGGSLGTPSSEAPAEDAPTPPESTPGEPSQRGEPDPKSRLSIAVVGERCRYVDRVAPCEEICASLDREGASERMVEIDATRGSHGTVEALRTCLEQAGFSDLRVRSE